MSHSNPTSYDNLFHILSGIWHTLRLVPRHPMKQTEIAQSEFFQTGKQNTIRRRLTSDLFAIDRLYSNTTVCQANTDTLNSLNAIYTYMSEGVLHIVLEQKPERIPNIFQISLDVPEFELFPSASTINSSFWGMSKSVSKKNANSLRSFAGILSVLAQCSSPKSPLTAGQVYAQLQQWYTLSPTTIASRRLHDPNYPIQTLDEQSIQRLSGPSPIVLPVILENQLGLPMHSSSLTLTLQMPTSAQCPSAITVSRTLAELSNWMIPEPRPSTYVECVVPAKGISQNYRLYSDWLVEQDTHSRTSSSVKPANTPTKKKTPDRHYYLASTFSPAEQHMLSDLIRVYPYMTRQQTEKFLSAIGCMFPGSPSHTGPRYASKQSDESLNKLFFHLEQLDIAIKQQKKVSMLYGVHQLALQPDGTWRPELTLRPSQKDTTNPMLAPYLIAPYELMWANGYYYLVAEHNGILKNFRVDRILELVTPPDNITFSKNPSFDPIQYRDRSPVMHPGKPERIQLQCNLSRISTILDVFGSAILEWGPPTLDGQTTVTLYTSLLGTRLFALQYMDSTHVLYPDTLRTELAATLQRAKQRYSAPVVATPSSPPQSPFQRAHATSTSSGGRTPPLSHTATHPKPDSYYISSILSPMEWRILSDLILVSPYVTQQQTEQFLRTLNQVSLGSIPLGVQRIAPKGDSKSIQKLFSHIEMLDRAIAQKKQIRIQYGTYCLTQRNGTWTPELKPRPSNSFHPSDSLILVEPYALLWANGYHYLVGKHHGTKKHFRVDRILSISPTTLSYETEPFDPYLYRDHCPVMYSGPAEHIQIRCDLSLISTVLDFFGSGIETWSPPNLTDKTFVITVCASRMGTRLFALEYIDRADVLFPPDLRADIRSTLEEKLSVHFES